MRFPPGNRIILHSRANVDVALTQHVTITTLTFTMIIMVFVVVITIIESVAFILPTPVSKPFVVASLYLLWKGRTRATGEVM